MNKTIYKMLNAHISALPAEPMDEQRVSEIMKRFRAQTHPSEHPAHRRLRTAVFTILAAAALSGTAAAAGRAQSVTLTKYAGQPPVYDADGNAVPHTAVEYEVNEDGLTYGSPVFSGNDPVYIEDYPDLMSVLGDHKISGYVYTKDMIGESPASPEEAAKWMEKQEKNGWQPVVLPVYAADGKTQIDTFTSGTRYG